jgi:protein-S-isoprenylcysteine O-methyltransferase Ste14
VITQIFIEIVYTFGAMRIAHHRHLTPTVQKKPFRMLVVILVLAGMVGLGINQYLSLQETNRLSFFILALLFNGLIALVSFKPIKQVAKGLTVD